VIASLSWDAAAPLRESVVEVESMAKFGGGLGPVGTPGPAGDELYLARRRQ